MHVNVINTDDPFGAFDALIYKRQHPNTISYIENQINNFSSTLTGIGKTFIEQSKNIYDKLNSSDFVNAAHAAIRTASGIFNDVIRPMYEVSEFRSAAPLMQRWIMANPIVRESYHRQECAGFVDTYVDLHPNDIGEKHYDYRRVMDGVVLDDKDGSYAMHYMDDLLPGDVELSHSEKVTVMNTWELLNMYFKAAKEDPTDPYNGNL